MTVQSGNNTQIHIEKATSNYYKILKLIEAIADESNSLPFTSSDMYIKAEGLKNYIELLNAMDNSIYLLALDGEKPVAFGYLEGGRRERTHHICNLGLGVLEAYQNQGIGRAIIGQLLAYAENSESIAKIDLQVRRDKLGAIKLYKELGFEVEGINKKALFVDGQFYDYINMGKTID